MKEEEGWLGDGVNDDDEDNGSDADDVGGTHHQHHAYGHPSSRSIISPRPSSSSPTRLGLLTIHSSSSSGGHGNHSGRLNSSSGGHGRDSGRLSSSRPSSASVNRDHHHHHQRSSTHLSLQLHSTLSAFTIASSSPPSDTFDFPAPPALHFELLLYLVFISIEDGLSNVIIIIIIIIWLRVTALSLPSAARAQHRLQTRKRKDWSPTSPTSVHLVSLKWKTTDERQLSPDC